MEFGDLRSLLSGIEEDTSIDWRNFVEVIGGIYESNPERFLIECLPYLEGRLSSFKSGDTNLLYHLRNGVLVPREVDARSITRISPILKHSEIVRTLISETGLVVRGNDDVTRQRIDSVLEHSSSFNGVSINYYYPEYAPALVEQINAHQAFRNATDLTLTLSDWSILAPVMNNGKVVSLDLNVSRESSENCHDHLEDVFGYGELKHLKISGLRNIQLSRILPHLDNLESLDLSDCYLGDQGATEIAESDHLGQLKNLCLDRCRIRDNGVTALASAFDTTLSSLEDFSLRQNNFHYFINGGRDLTNSRLGHLYNSGSYQEYDSLMNG